MKAYYYAILALLCLNCASTKSLIFKNDTLSLIAKSEIAHNLNFENTTIGGLSGVSYDQAKNVYYFISDDRSNFNPARFYTAALDFNWKKQKISFKPKSVVFLKTKKGDLFESSKTNALKSIDPEEIRWNANTNSLFVSDEGERIIGKNNVLINPSIFEVNLNGKTTNKVKLPYAYFMSKNNIGLRRNGTLEAFDITTSGNYLLTTTEEPLLQDGESSTTTHQGLLRLAKINLKQKTKANQYIYQLEKLAYLPKPAEAFGVNGLVAILAINDTQFWSIERSYSTGRQQCTIKLFKCDIADADDVTNAPSLINNNFKKIKKQLVLNFDDLGIHVDNIEGLSYGPTLENGHKTLIMVSDNNFSEKQKTQLFVFEQLQ